MTPQTQFTPGPWEISNDPAVITSSNAGNDLGFVAMVLPDSALDWNLTAEAEANARLIASAPSLYAALQAAEAWISTVLAGSNIPLDKQPFSKSVLEQAREALDLGSSTSC